MSTNDITEYTPELEDLFVQYLISDPEIMTRCMTITKDKYFEYPKAKKAIGFIVDYVTKYNMPPSVEILNKGCGLEYMKLEPKEAAKHVDWFLETYELFCRHRALELETVWVRCQLPSMFNNCFDNLSTFAHLLQQVLKRSGQSNLLHLL